MDRTLDYNSSDKSSGGGSGDRGSKNDGNDDGAQISLMILLMTSPSTLRLRN